MRSSKLIVVVLGSAIAAGGLMAAGRDDNATATMHEIFDAVAYLLPASISAVHNQDYADRALVDRKLAELSASSDALLAHTRGGEQEFQLLAKAFDHRIADVRAAFESDYPSFAYFALMGLIEHCTACHSRLPDNTDFVFGQRLLARMNVDEIDREDLADILVATRQFDMALSELETELADPAIHPIDHDLAGTLIHYLNVSIAVQQNMDRPLATLQNYLKRSDLPYFLQRRVTLWLADMRRLKADLAEAPDFNAALQLFEVAGQSVAVPGDRSAAVKDLVAASMLRRLLAGGLSQDRTAVAYYMLGVIALRTSELRPSVPEMELLLVAAIEADPQGPLAKDAFALLEEYGFIEDQRLSADPNARPLIDMAALEAKVLR